MSSGGVRKVSLQEIQLVQNLIERCLQLYMTESEVVSTLLDNAKIEPGFTELVWQRLEAENQEFFKAYHLRLKVKDQIQRFNQLLEKQAKLMQQVGHVGVSSVPLSNGSQIHSMHDNSAYQAPYGPTENLHPANTNVYSNGVSSCMQVAVNMGDHAGRNPLPENIPLAQSSNAGLMQGMNEGIINSGGAYPGDSLFTFGADNSLLEPRNSPYDGGNPSLQMLDENMLEPEMNSFGILGQLPQNLSFPDLTADYSNDILGSCQRSPFMGTGANFLDPQIRGEQQGPSSSGKGIFVSRFLE
ncbi:hypothetical protein ACJIZ3_005619 [Penstemon smallii]|uniref:Uncharacterized protein n=1 Tax=Penstemon smallii TaxID=265156 RepID=A0ABD3S5E6_9LAMI